MTMTTRSPAVTEAISVYDAIGGRAALTAAVDRFYGRLLADPALGPLPPWRGCPAPGLRRDDPRRGAGRPRALPGTRHRRRSPWPRHRRRPF